LHGGGAGRKFSEETGNLRWIFLLLNVVLHLMYIAVRAFFSFVMAYKQIPFHLFAVVVTATSTTNVLTTRKTGKLALTLPLILSSVNETNRRFAYAIIASHVSVAYSSVHEYAGHTRHI